MLKKIILVLLLLNAVTFSLSYKVSGTLRAPENNPVAGARVSLVGTNIFQTTDSSGYFSFNFSMVNAKVPTTGTTSAKFNIQKNGIRIHGDAHGQKYSIQLYKLNGQCVFKQIGETKDHLLIPLSLTNSNTLVMSLRIGTDSYLGKLVVNGERIMFTPSRSSLVSNSSQKASTTICKDTLMVTHWRHRTIKIPISDYSCEINQTVPYPKLHMKFLSNQYKIDVNPCKVTIYDSTFAVDSVRYTDSIMNGFPVFGANQRNPSQQYYKSGGDNFNTHWTMPLGTGKKVIYAEVHKKDNTKDTLYDEVVVRDRDQATMHLDTNNCFKWFTNNSALHELVYPSLTFSVTNIPITNNDEFDYWLLIGSDIKNGTGNYYYETRPLRKKLIKNIFDQYDPCQLTYAFDTSKQGKANLDSMHMISSIRDIKFGDSLAIPGSINGKSNEIAIPESLSSKFSNYDLIQRNSQSIKKPIFIVCQFKGKYFGETRTMIIPTFKYGSINYNQLPPYIKFQQDSLESNILHFRNDTLQLPYTYKVNAISSSFQAGYEKTITKIELICAKKPDSLPPKILQSNGTIQEEYLRSLAHVSVTKNVNIPYPGSLSDLTFSLDSNLIKDSGAYLLAFITTDNFGYHGVAWATGNCKLPDLPISQRIDQYAITTVYIRK